MFNNDIITIFNSYVDEARKTKYTKTYLYGVDWQDKNSMSINQVRGIMNDDEISIFIDYDVNAGGKLYMPPKAFLRLSENERDRYYTFKQNDKVVKGIIDFEFDENNTLKDLETLYDNVVDIKTIISCDMMDYFEVGCE